MRIGLFTDAYLPEISGVTLLVRRLRDELTRCGHDVWVYAPRYARPCDDERQTFRFRAGPVFAYKTARMSVPYNHKAARSYRRLDIVHSHTPFSLAYAALAAAYRHRVPHVQTYHTYLSEYRHYIPRAFRPSVRAAEAYSALLCNRCTAVTVPTRSIEGELRRFGVRRPIFVLPSGPDVRLFGLPAVWEPRRALDIPEGARIFLYAGRVAEEKNLRFLVRAFGRIHALDSTVVFVLAGDGPSRTALEAQAAAAGLRDAVRFTGFLDQARLVDLYRAADLFVFASKSETQGLVLVEAMAGRTPAVAVRARGVCDVIDHGVNGFLVSEDEEAFARRALDAVAERAGYERLADAAYDTAVRTSIQSSTQKLLTIYLQSIETLRRSRRHTRGRFGRERRTA